MANFCNQGNIYKNMPSHRTNQLRQQMNAIVRFSLDIPGINEDNCVRHVSRNPNGRFTCPLCSHILMSIQSLQRHARKGTCIAYMIGSEENTNNDVANDLMGIQENQSIEDQQNSTTSQVGVLQTHTNLAGTIYFITFLKLSRYK